MARRQTPPIESLAKPAIVAAVIVAVGQLVLSLLSRVINGGQIDFVNVLLDELIGILGDAALFGAVVAVFVVGTSAALLLRAGAVLYVVNLIENVLFTLNSPFGQIQPTILIGPLFTVVFFLGFVMALRVYRGETILPGVDVRV
jgi:hypothetical protein